MANKKVVKKVEPKVEVPEVKKEAPVVEEVENKKVVKPNGVKEFETLMATYKEQNPEKYKAKEESFKKKLEELSK